MSTTVDLSERDLKLAVVKITFVLTGLIALLAVLAVRLFGAADGVTSVVVTMALITVAANFLINGFLGVLKIIDWFEARKERRL